MRDVPNSPPCQPAATIGSSSACGKMLITSTRSVSITAKRWPWKGGRLTCPMAGLIWVFSEDYRKKQIHWLIQLVVPLIFRHPYLKVASNLKELPMAVNCAKMFRVLKIYMYQMYPWSYYCGLKHEQICAFPERLVSSRLLKNTKQMATVDPFGSCPSCSFQIHSLFHAG